MTNHEILDKMASVLVDVFSLEEFTKLNEDEKLDFLLEKARFFNKEIADQSSSLQGKEKQLKLYKSRLEQSFLLIQNFAYAVNQLAGVISNNWLAHREKDGIGKAIGIISTEFVGVFKRINNLDLSDF